MIDFARLAAANAPINAFLDFDRGAAFGDGPLSGVTVGVKANIAVRGLPWTAGMRIFRDRIATRDASCVAALRAAGAAIVGTLNMEEAALGAKTDNPFFGRTDNPHRAGYTPGGSSGGSGAAVAAGLCDIALGTDTMGSVRIPASYCGVYGFKPAQTSVSQEGLEPAEASLDVIGPLARSLDLLERAARLTGIFGDDADADPAPPVTLRAMGGVECSADVLRVFDHARDLCGCTGDFALEDAPSRIRYAGFIATARALHAAFGDADEGAMSPLLRKLIAYGPRRSDADRAEDERVIARTRAALEAQVERHGVIILPTAPQPAFPHADPAPANQADLTCLANIANLPAISLPAGWSGDGLPIGVQLIGRRGAEAGLFALARTLDSRLAAYRRPDPFFQQ